MPFNNTGLANEIIAELKSAGFQANDQSKKVWAAIAKAILDHIKSNGMVSTTDSNGDQGRGTIS